MGRKFEVRASHGCVIFLVRCVVVVEGKSAHYGWERVQTNELLIQMQRFTGVLV